MKSILTFLCLLSFLTNSLAQKDSTIITLLHVNDVHANINAFPQLKFVVDSIRLTNDEVFLLAAGDLFSGNPIVDRHEKKGWPLIDLMNDIQFDATALGNHDFDYGIEVLNQRTKDANFPFLCANISKDTLLDELKDFILLESQSGYRLAVVSFIQLGRNDLPDSHPQNFKGLTFTQAEEAIKPFKKELKSYDLQIALTHLGLKKDLELAKDNQWLDLVIGGHSHSMVQPAKQFGKVLVTQAGSYVKYLGMTQLVIYNGKLLSLKNELLPLKNSQSDLAMLKKVEGFSNRPELHKTIAHIPYTVSSAEELGVLMCDAFREGLNVDIALQNIGGVRANGLNEGNITLLEIMALDPFNNEIMIFDMDVKDLLSFLRYSYTVRNHENQLMSGIKAEYKTNTQGELVDIVLSDHEDQALDPNTKYRVAINSYMANVYKFSVKEQAQYTGKFSNDLIIDYFRKQFPLQKE